VLKVSKADNQRAIDPIDRSDLKRTKVNYDVVWSGEYPLARPLFIYSLRESGEIKRFLEWILGEEGQKIAVELGYIPLNKAVVADR